MSQHIELSREELVCIIKLALAGLYTSEELGQTQTCRGAVEIRHPAVTQTGDDPATPLLTPSESQAASGEGRDTLPAIPLPLQPFVDQGMTRQNIQACFGFIQAELERMHGEEGTRIFRRLWLALPRIFKTKEEAREKTIACWCQMWSYVETGENREAA